MIELIVTMVVAGVLVAVVAPSFVGIIKSDTATTQANSLVSLLAYARTEAVKQDASILVCPSADGQTCGTNWALGMMVYCKVATVTTDVCLPLGGNTNPLRVAAALAAGNTLTATSGGVAATTITFLPSGMLSGGAVSFNLCDAQQEPQFARDIELLVTGRAEASPYPGKNFKQLALTCP